MSKIYGYDTDVQHSWAIFEIGSEAAPINDSGDFKGPGNPEDEGEIIGSSEWIWLTEENAKKVVDALNSSEREVKDA